MKLEFTDILTCIILEQSREEVFTKEIYHTTSKEKENS